MATSVAPGIGEIDCQHTLTCHNLLIKAEKSRSPKVEINSWSLPRFPSPTLHVATQTSFIRIQSLHARTTQHRLLSIPHPDHTISGCISCCHIQHHSKSMHKHTRVFDEGDWSLMCVCVSAQRSAAISPGTRAATLFKIKVVHSQPHAMLALCRRTRCGRRMWLLARGVSMLVLALHLGPLPAGLDEVSRVWTM